MCRERQGGFWRGRRVKDFSGQMCQWLPSPESVPEILHPFRSDSALRAERLDERAEQLLPLRLGEPPFGVQSVELRKKQ